MLNGTQNLALVIHSLDGGGAQRALSLLANHWTKQGRHVTLISLDRESRDAFPLEPSVQRIGLDIVGESRNLLHAVRQKSPADRSAPSRAAAVGGGTSGKLR